MSERVPRKLRAFVLAGTCALAMDQLSKQWLLGRASEDPNAAVFSFFGGTLSVALQESAHFAFGLLTSGSSLGRGIVLGVVALVLVGVAVSLYRGLGFRDRANALALGLVVGGGLGNLVDGGFRGAGLAIFVLDAGTAGRSWSLNLGDVFILAGIALLGVELLVAEGAARARSALPHDD